MNMAFFRKKQNQVQVITGQKLDQLNYTLASSFANVQKDTVKIFQWLNFLHQKNMQQEFMIQQLRTELKYMPKSREEIKEIIDKHYAHESILEKIRQLESAIELLNQNHEKLPKHIERFHSNLAHDEHLEPHLSLLQRKLESLHSRIDILETEKSEPSKEFPEELTKKMEELHTRLGRIESIKPAASFPLELQNKLVELNSRLHNIEQKKQSIKERIIKKITKNSKEYVKSIILSYIRKYGNITALQLKEMVVDEQGLCSKSSFYRLLEEIEQSQEIASIKKGKEKHYMAKISKKSY